MTPGEEHMAFYHEIGLTLTQWSMVERFLFSIAALCVESAQVRMFGDAYSGIENFRSKLLFVDRLFKSRFEKTKHLADWTKIHDRLVTLAPKRNKLVHQPLMIYPSEEIGKRYRLIPWFLDTSARPKAGKPPKGSLHVRDINRIRLEFSAISMTMINFSARVQGQKEMIPKSAELPKGPMMSRDIATQIRAILGPQRLSVREKRKAEDEANAAASLLIPIQ